MRAGEQPHGRVVRQTVALEAPSAAVLANAASVLHRGGLVVFPTDTLYALGADASNPAAVERVFAVKGRHLTSPIPLLVADLTMAVRLVGELPESAIRLADRYWPGPLTLVVPAPGSICALLTAGTGRIGVRVPGAAVALALIREFGGPVTGTSANRSGAPDPLDAHEVLDQLGDRIDVVLDGGRLAAGRPSTVVDVTASPPVIIRPGPVGHEEIRRVLGL